jgi:hypothetical protein
MYVCAKKMARSFALRAIFVSQANPIEAIHNGMPTMVPMEQHMLRSAR